MLALINLVSSHTPEYLDGLSKFMAYVKANKKSIKTISLSYMPYSNDKYSDGYIKLSAMLRSAKIYGDVAKHEPFRKICHRYLYLEIIGENKATEAPVITPINCEYNFVKKIMKYAATPLPSLAKELKTKINRYARRHNWIEGIDTSINIT